MNNILAFKIKYINNFIFYLIIFGGLFWQVNGYSQNGPVKTYYTDDTVKSEINYVDSVRSGPAKFYYTNGKIQAEMNYSNGKIEGVVKEYYDDGNLRTIYSIEDGKRNGAESLFDESGKYIKDIAYDNGKLVPEEEPEADTTVKIAAVQKDTSGSGQNITEAKINKLKKEAAQVTAPPEVKENENPDYLTSAEVMPEPAGGINTIMKKLIYPESAREDKIQGIVKIKAFVDEFGEVTQDEVVQGIGHGCDEAAKIAVYYTKFTPGLIKGKPVKVQIVIPIEFKLQK